MSRAIAVLLLLLLALPAGAYSDFFPLPEEGSWWSYRVTTSSGEVRTKKRTVQSITDENDGTWHFEFTLDTAGVRSKEHYYLHETGVFFEGGSDQDAGPVGGFWPPYMVLAADDKAKPSFHYQGVLTRKGLETPVDETSLVRGVEDVRVPAGVFPALRVDVMSAGTPPVLLSSCWYAKGVGLVKRTRSGMTEELVDFSHTPYRDKSGV